MDLYEAIEGRRSIRIYKPDPVDRAALDRIIAAAAAAPSSMNSQPWRFHVATGKTREAVGQVMAQSTLHLKDYIGVLDQEHLKFAESFYADLGNAPVVVAVSAPVAVDELDKINTCTAIGCALQNFALAATAEGLGSCSLTFSFWVRDELAEVYSLPEGREIISLIVLGHPAETPAAPSHSLDIATFQD